MCSHLAKRLISSHFHFHFSSSPFQHHLSLLLIPTQATLRFSLSTQPQPHQELPFIAQYLVSSFGFAPHRALKYSNRSHLAAIRSPDCPESVVKFLKDTGLSDSQIKATISFYPILLAYNVDKTFKPKVHKLIENGFSRELLVQLIRYNPAVLYLKDTLSRLLFWRDFIGKGDQGLLEIIPKCNLLFTFDINKQVVPFINLLKEYELPNRDIVSLLTVRTCFKGRPDSFRQTLELIEEVGILRGSRMFLCAIKAVSYFSHDTLIKKLEFLKRTYGWSQEEVYAAFRKFPKIVSYSEDKLNSTMDFLIRKAGFESRCIVLQPVLFSCSIERVLIPRYTVLSALQAKGLKIKCSLLSASVMSESNFLKRYVVPYEKDVPGLGEAYSAARGVRVQ